MRALLPTYKLLTRTVTSLRLHQRQVPLIGRIRKGLHANERSSMDDYLGWLLVQHRW